MSTPPTTSPWVPVWDLNGAVGLTYRGAYVAATQYADGDIVVYNGVAYICVRPTTNPPGPWAAATSIPQPVVNGQRLKGSGGSVVWSAITPADVVGLGTWQAYTPTWVTSSNPQPVLGNGSVSGRYTQIGKLVLAVGHWGAGSTTQYGNGSFLFYLPSVAPGLYWSTLGNAWVFRAGVGTFPQAICRVSGAGTHVVEFLFGGATRPLGPITGIGSTPPWGGAWASGDTIDWSLAYEAA